MKKTIIMILLAVAAVTASAQAPVVSLRAGAGFSDITGEDSDDSSNRFSYGVRLGVNLPLYGVWSVHTGVGVVKKGAEECVYTIPTSSTNKINAYYLDIPAQLAARLEVPSFDIILRGGPYLSVGMGGKIRGRGHCRTFGDGRESIRNVDSGLGLGVDFEFDDGLIIGLDASYGLRRLRHGESIYNRSILLSAGFLF